MTKIKRRWWIATVTFLLLGLVTLIPLGNSSSYLGYSTLGPYTPISTVALWAIGLIFYLTGRWVTRKRLRRP